MFKTVSQFILLLVVLVFVAGVSGYLSYVVTSNILSAEADLTENAEKTPRKTIDKKTSEDEKTQNQHLSLDFYIVRLEGQELSVYASSDGEEEFLYNEPIYVNDLSAEDIETLRTGVNLKNSSELTGFIENFTS